MPKGSGLRFLFSGAALPEGSAGDGPVRLRVAVPAGLDLDLEATRAANPGWDVEVEGDAAAFSAGPDTLARIRAGEAPRVALVGTARQDGAVYASACELSVGAASAVSEPVRAMTPGGPVDGVERVVPPADEEGEAAASRDSSVSPEAAVHLADGSRAPSGSPIAPGEASRWVVTWDLDQYAGMRAEGAFALVVQGPFGPEGVVARDAAGREVAVEAARYASAEEAPEWLCGLMARAGIAPEGPFATVAPAEGEVQRLLDAGSSLAVSAPTGGDPGAISAWQLDFGRNGYAAPPVSWASAAPRPVSAIERSDGSDANGLELARGERVAYSLHWDLSPYAGMRASDGTLSRPFCFLEAVTPGAYGDALSVGATGPDGEEVAMRAVDAAEAGEAIAALARGLYGDAAVTAYVPVDQAAFARDYALSGKDVTIRIEREVARDAPERIEHASAQADFGIATASNPLSNGVADPAPAPEPEPRAPEASPALAEPEALPRLSDAQGMGLAAGLAAFGSAIAAGIARRRARRH